MSEPAGPGAGRGAPPPEDGPPRTAPPSFQVWGGWLTAAVFAALAALIAVYFLLRENQWLRAELEKVREQAARVDPAPPRPGAPTPPGPRWLPGGAPEPAALPVETPATLPTQGTRPHEPAPRTEAAPFHPEPSPPAPTASAPLTQNILAGLVLDEGRRPIAGATVVAVHGEPPTEHTARAGPDGRFVINGIEAEALDRVRVVAEGFATIEAADVPLPLDDYEIVLNRLIGLNATIRRLDARGQAQPVSGMANVFIFKRGRGDEARGLISVLADAAEIRAGSWRSGMLEPADYRLGVLFEGEYAESETVTLSGPGGGEVVVDLGRRVRLEGTVLSDPDRTPVRKPSLTLRMTSRPSAAGVAPPITTHGNDDGRFEFPGVPPGVYSLTISADLHTTRTISGIPVSDSASARPATFFLRKAVPGLEVRVLDPDGQPVFESAITVAAIGRSADGPWFGQTGADGSFRIEALATGRYTISATLPGRRIRQRLREVTIDEKRTQTVEMRFLPLVEVKGRVARDGKPYQGGLTVQAPDSVVSEAVIQTDAQGLFSALLEPGEWVLLPVEGKGRARIPVAEGAAEPLAVELK